MNRGIIGTIIGVLHHHSGDRDSSAHLSAEPGAGAQVAVCPGPPSQRSLAPPSAAPISPVLPGPGCCAARY